MEILSSDFKKNIVKLKVTRAEDLWYLLQIIDTADHVSGTTLRKITVGGEGEKTQHTQKKVTLQIIVEKTESTTDALRISGKITQGPEDVSLGSYHTFNIVIGDVFTLEKEQFLAYQKKYLEEATSANDGTILICVFDREEALIARSMQSGYEVLTTITSQAQKKEVRAQSNNEYYPDITKALESYTKRYKPQHVILASPAFYKDDLAKILPSSIKSKLTLATCSSASQNAIAEVLRRPETKNAVQQVRIAREQEIVSQVLQEVSGGGLVTYGCDHVQAAVDSGAASDLIITDTFIADAKETKTFKEINQLMIAVEQMRGAIHIISTAHESGKTLQGLGGIAALLRYKSEW